MATLGGGGVERHHRGAGCRTKQRTENASYHVLGVLREQGHVVVLDLCGDLSVRDLHCVGLAVNAMEAGGGFVTYAGLFATVRRSRGASLHVCTLSTAYDWPRYSVVRIE